MTTMIVGLALIESLAIYTWLSSHSSLCQSLQLLMRNFTRHGNRKRDRSMNLPFYFC